MSDNQQQLGEAWDSFTDSLKALGHEALATAPNDWERVDGLRFILRQLAYREEQFLEFAPGYGAELFLPESPTRKVFADCPDTLYWQFSVAKGGVYQISGTRGESPYISFTAYRAGIEDRVVADLHDGELDITEDGTFELLVGGPDAGKNWLDLGDDATFVIIREYTHDRVNGVKASFDVEQLSPELSHRPEPDADALSGVLALLGMGLGFVNNATVNLSEELRIRPNQMNEAAAELVSEMAGNCADWPPANVPVPWGRVDGIIGFASYPLGPPAPRTTITNSVTCSSSQAKLSSWRSPHPHVGTGACTSTTTGSNHRSFAMANRCASTTARRSEKPMVR